MHAIYIKNYLNLPKKEKKKFLTYIQIEKALPLIEQKVLFAESSLLLTFKEDRDSRELKNLFDAYFTRSNIPLTTYIVNNIIAKDDNLIIEFNHRKLRIKS